MRTPFLVAVLALVQASTALASDSDSDFSLRIQQAQNSLLSQGSTTEVLGEYDELISAIAKSGQSEVPQHSVAQVYYQRSLIEISLGKSGLAIADLIQALDIDPKFRPASKKLMELWLDRGQFQELKARFSEQDSPELYSTLQEWDTAYQQLLNTLDQDPDLNGLGFCLGLIDDTLLPLTRNNVLLYELRAKVSKKKAILEYQQSKDVAYGEIVRDYTKLLRLSPQRNLQQYSEFSQYLLFTRGSFEEAWNTVKSGLRIDNDHKPCGSLSKIYNRLQNVLKPLEDYFLICDYLYPASSSSTVSDISDEKLAAFNVDYKQVFDAITGPLTLSKRDMKDLPTSVKTVYDFLLFRAKQFTLAEFGDEKMAESLPFIEVLNKFVCEASVRTKGNKKKYCALVKDANQPFLPKHLAHIDSLLKKKDYHSAKELLSQYNKNVQKTTPFQKRWNPIQEFEQRQHQRQQQQQQQQQQEYYRQQQQQQQGKFDRSKDYYKVLDVSKDADEKTLKKAYRTQTLKYHPDKYKGKDLTEKQIESKMQDINEAYEILSDPETRAEYDRDPQEQFHGGGGHFQQNHGGQNVHFNFDPEQFMGHFGSQFGGNGFQFQF